MQLIASTPCPRCGSALYSPRVDADTIRREIRLRERFVFRRFDYKPASAELMDLTEFMHGGAGRILACAGCGLMARDEDNSPHYEDDVYDPDLLDHLYPRYLDAFKAKQKQYQELLPARAEVIEAGSHLGAFLETAEGWGWRPTGLDIGEHTSAFCRRRGLRVRRETVEDAKLPAHAADALFLWNCFEQLERPEDLLRYAHRLLARHALLVVRTPNIAFYTRRRDSLKHQPEALRDLAYNNLLGFPYHWGFSPPALASLCRVNGFDPLMGFDSTLLTMPFPAPSEREIREETAVRQRNEREQPLPPAALQGPWIEIVCRKRPN